jgi:hypothetical protein
MVINIMKKNKAGERDYPCESRKEWVGE